MRPASIALHLATTLIGLAALSPRLASGQSPAVRAAGLEPGERLVALAPAPARDPDRAPDEGLVFGRVLDAFTARPIAGATVEIWCEEIDTTFGGFHRFGESRSGADGRFAVTAWSGGTRGEKARVSAPGYLTRSATVGDVRDDVRLFPAAKEPFRVRILDARGRAIPGARITTTYSCSHDLPAFDVRTDMRGFATCPAFGLQDQVPELRVRAPGHAAIEYLDADAVMGRGADTGPLTVHLPRRRPFTVRLLDRKGDALAETPVRVIDDECYHVIRTDKRGVMRVDNRFGNAEVNLEMLLEPRGGHIAFFTPPRERSVVLRRYPDAWEDETPLGSVRIDWGGRDPEKEDATIHLFHADGWAREIDNPSPEPIEFPAGAAFLVVGGPFLGHKEEIHDFEIVAKKEVVVRPAFVREPRVTVKGPEGGETWIQAGEDVIEDVKLGEPLTVPAGQPLCVFHRGEKRSLRLFTKPVADGATLDLSAAETVHTTTDAGWASVVQAFRFTTAEGKPVEGELVLRGGHGEAKVVVLLDDEGRMPDPAERTHAITGRPGTTWLVRFRAKGHEPIWVRGTFASDARVLTRVVPRSASLRLEAPFKFRVRGYDADDLRSLAPGPLELVVERDDGARFGLTLVLRPGANRVIKLGSG